MQAAPFVAGSVLAPPPGDVLSSWTFEPVCTTILVVGVATLSYAVWKVRGEYRWPWWRAVLVGTGVLAAVLALDSWPGVYARGLFSVFMSQQLVLLLLAPVLIAFGQPWVPLRTAWPGLRAPVPIRRGADLIGHPLVGPLLIPVTFFVLLFTPLLHAVVYDTAAAWGLHLVLLALGLAVAVPLAREDVDATSLAVGVAVFVGVAELLLDAIPAIALRLDGHVLATIAGLAGQRSGGPSPIRDQQLGSSILWGVAELLDLPFLIVAIRRWIRVDTRDAQRVDAALDRAVALPAVHLAAQTPGPQVVPPETDRPWWEIDAGVFGDHRSAALRRNPGQERRP